MSEASRIVYVGCGDWGSEKGKIQVYRLTLATGALALLQEFPAGGIAAFMARSQDGKVLYVADEGRATLASYAIEPDGKLRPLNRVTTAGNPVYAAVHPNGKSIATCFFNEGKTQIFALEADGTLGASHGIYDSGRESHCTVFDHEGRFLFVPTRGDEWVAQYRFDAHSQHLTANEPAHLHAPSGSGPRHITFHPTRPFAYLVNELSVSLSVYALDPRGVLSPVQESVRTAPLGQSEGSGADVHVHPGGRFVYVSNRQADHSTIAILSIDPLSGRVSVVGHEPTRGRTPRNFALDRSGSLMIVANQDSNTLVSFAVDAETGLLAHLGTVPCAEGPFFVGIY
jgi:6-phosphogluconolactonase